MSHASATRPIKLRAACNQCNATKVKCSGERTGCTRCQTFQVACVYAESRVGRVPGIRAKRKSKTNANISATNINAGATGTADEVAASNTITESHESASSPKSTVHDGNRTPAAEFEDVVLNWNAEMSQMGAMYNDDFFESLNQNEEQQMSLLGEDHFEGGSPAAFSPSGSISNIPGLDFDTSGTRPQSFLAGSNVPWSSEPTVAEPKAPQACVDGVEYLSNGQCVIVCSQMISSLERYLVDDLKVLDFILGIIKQVTLQLNPLVELHRERQDAKCLTLFGVICVQIVELLEAGCTNFFAEELDQNRKSNSFGALSSSLPGLGFDTFNITSKDQRRWRSQIILDEMRPLSEILHVLNNSMATNLQVRHNAQPGCYRDLIARLNTLVEQLKK